MLNHTPVSTSPLPDNDKNHCHYKATPISRVTGQSAVHGLVRVQNDPSIVCAHVQYMCAYVCVCNILDGN